MVLPDLVEPYDSEAQEYPGIAAIAVVVAVVEAAAVFATVADAWANMVESLVVAQLRVVVAAVAEVAQAKVEVAVHMAEWLVVSVLVF